MMVEFEDAFIRDEMAKDKEPFQRPYEFLFTGRKPKVGQRTETQLNVAGGQWCVLSGIVTEVGELPTFDMWITTSSLAPPLSVCGCSPDPYGMMQPDTKMGFSEQCPYPDCTMCILRKGDKEISLGTLMDRVLEHFGTLQNQQLTGFSYLNFDFFDKEDSLPVKSGRIYKTVYKCKDSSKNMWTVESMQDVTDLPTSELPQVFKDWEIGRQSADVAPFDLSDLDRKVWYLQNEVEWTREVLEDELRVAKLAEEHAGDEEFDFDEHRDTCGPYSAKSAVFFFARDSCPAIMTTPKNGDADDSPELKDLLRQCITKFEALSAEEHQVWEDRAAEDVRRYQREMEASGLY